jgi:hypothetical protein
MLLMVSEGAVLNQHSRKLVELSRRSVPHESIAASYELRTPPITQPKAPLDAGEEGFDFARSSWLQLFPDVGRTHPGLWATLSGAGDRPRRTSSAQINPVTRSSVSSVFPCQSRCFKLINCLATFSPISGCSACSVVCRWTAEGGQITVLGNRSETRSIPTAAVCLEVVAEAAE